MPKSWRISGPFLSDEERAQALAPGGLSGQHVDLSKLLGKPARETGERVFKPSPMFAALQSMPHIYAGTVDPEVVARRRAKNRHARRARRGNTAAIARQARLNRQHRNRFGADEFPVTAFLAGGA